MTTTLLTPTPFKIDIPDSALDALKAKLAAATLPPPAPPSDDPWEYGVPLSEMTKFLEYWRTQFDWRAAEKALNTDLPQFTLPIDVAEHGTLSAHFVYQKSTRADAIPLLFLHGWPGHFGEVRKILPLLTNPEKEDDPAFHVVAPSLPGFGFSSAPEKAGFGIPQYAEFGHNLMQALGYKTYVVQGGDWGFLISHRLVSMYGPTHVKAWHTNFPAGRVPRFTHFPGQFLKFWVTPWSDFERKGIQRTQWFQKRGRAYFELQSTTPQTLSYALADSPVALLAWIYERLVMWTDSYPWTEEEVLTWISIYLLSGSQSTSSASTAVRIYYEAANGQQWAAVGSSQFYNGGVPMGVSLFPKELVVVPETFRRTLGNIVYTGIHEKGGHFAAFEQPEVLVEDIRNMFKLKSVLSKL